LVTLLVVIALLVAALLGFKSCRGGSAGTTNKTPVARTPVSIKTAAAFDPTADKGNGEENDDQVPLSHDGKPDTAWRTSTYLNKATFGGLKAGVGVVYDLGESVDVRTVELTLEGNPSSIQILAPKTDAGGVSAPKDSVSDWMVVAQDDKAGTTVSLSTPQAIPTRWVLVYFTSLPNIGGNRYRGGIAEVVIDR